MARKPKRAPHSIRLRMNVPVEIRRVPFKTFESVRHLDVDRLSRAAHARFEVGRFEAGCCKRTVHAVVRKGRVTKLEVESCGKAKRPSPDVQKLFAQASKKLAQRPSGSRRLPVDVRSFLADAGGLTIDVSFCFSICIFGWCLICCYDSESPGTGGCTVFEDDWPTP